MKKIIVISDTHLTTRFNQKKFDALKKVFENCDQIIFNGDLWENAIINFDQFLNSKWHNLFSLMKSKKTIYIHGNHDREIDIDDRAYKFCDKLVSGDYKFKSGKFNYLVKHGHEDSKISGLVYKILRDDPKLVYWLTYPFDFPQKLNEYIVTKFDWGLQHLLNNNLKNQKRAKTEYLITSHTHSPEIDHKKRYINTGFTNFGVIYYVEITGKPRLIKTFY